MDDGSTVVCLTLLLKRNKRNNLELMFSHDFYGIFRLYAVPVSVWLVQTGGLRLLVGQIAFPHRTLAIRSLSDELFYCAAITRAKLLIYFICRHFTCLHLFFVCDLTAEFHG